MHAMKHDHTPTDTSNARTAPIIVKATMDWERLNRITECLFDMLDFSSRITSVLSERPLKLADQNTERGKAVNPEYNINRDQPARWASPLRINTLLCPVFSNPRQILNQQIIEPCCSSETVTALVIFHDAGKVSSEKRWWIVSFSSRINVVNLIWL